MSSDDDAATTASLSSSSSSFAIHDAVQIIAGEHVNKEGVVAYLGPVAGLASENHHWMGIRLTGPSAGHGQHNGTYQGTEYFVCPDSCGVFVPIDQVTKRTLTKLEELRLRRELAGKAKALSTSSSSTVSSSNSTTTTSTTPAKVTPLIVPSTPSAATVTTDSTTTTTLAPETPIATTTATTPRVATTRHKLEELKKRRAALTDRKGGDGGEGPGGRTGLGLEASLSRDEDAVNTTTTSSAPGTPSRSSAATGVITTTTPSPGVVNDDDNKQLSYQLSLELARVQAQLRDTIAEAATLRQQVSSAEVMQQELQQQLQRTQQELDTSKLEAAKLAAAAATATSPTTTTSTSETALPPQVVDQLNQFRRERDEATEQAQVAWREVNSRRAEWERDQKTLVEVQNQLHDLQAQLALKTQDLQVLEEQTQHRSRSDASQYKERARLQAEMSAVKRKVEQLESEKVELENTIEDLTLDKEQLSEEKEALQDRLEEIKLDYETAQMEVEELKLELEDARAASERESHLAQQEQAAVAETQEQASGAAAADAEELQRALSVQNARLREALIRLREQSMVEKMDLTRQLREAEKKAQTGQALSDELENLRALKLQLEEQINDLKDMVEQGSAFEDMVEDLSDRVLALEEDNVALRATIREMEEAADLTAEMEEVQNDEIKALTQDLEGRDSIIRNLEEAIKMQRRREEDFLRTVANYRNTVTTLKQEKQALLELHQGGEGEKTHLLAASQNALARAAQLVSDAAEIRRREARAIMDQIEQQMYRHMSVRLETLLPPNVVSPELSAMKGELMASMLVGKASKTLEGIGASFGKAIKPLLSSSAERPAAGSWSSNAKLSDELRQKVTTMFYQAEFAQLIVDLSSQFVRLIAAGQWPDLLSQESSVELGSILSHAVPDLDSLLGTVLKSLKEEGTLTPEQSNIGALHQSFQVTMQGLKSDIERDDGALLGSEWNPAGWDLMRDVSLTKFVCQGTAAAMSSVIHQTDEYAAPNDLAEVYNNMEQAATQAAALTSRLANLDVHNDKLVKELSSQATQLKSASVELSVSVQAALLSGGGLQTCESMLATVLQMLAKISSTLRSAKVPPSEEERAHALSPEVHDAWLSIANLSRSIRAVDGDEEDVNYLIRARSIEQRLGDAVENEPKLETAKARVAQLEKSLASRVKEVSMQAARLTELEKLLAKSSAGAVGRQAIDMRSTEEFKSLQEENRVLTEAMDVLQRQVDEYENEIRSLKDFKSPGRAKNRTPRRVPSSGSDSSPYNRSSVGAEDITKTGALEAAIFRPALQRALQDAARWKAASMASNLASLPPLPVPIGLSTSGNDMLELTAALCNYRAVKANTKLIDLTKRDKTPRLQLREMNEKRNAAVQRVQSLVNEFQGRALQ